MRRVARGACETNELLETLHGGVVEGFCVVPLPLLSASCRLRHFERN